MYKRFKEGIKTGTEQATHDAKQHEKEPEPASNPEVKNQVASLWKTILSLCDQDEHGHRDSKPPHAQATPSSLALSEWQTVRIFVSSTFIDFFSEREVLVKKVFPELREWCHERRLKLVECDLRWGVPKEATSTQALLTCLEEIDRCIDANHQPFFLNMLGERYGWIPEETEVPEEVRQKYNWIDGTSMTFMELLHGALRISNPNASFFLRDPGFISRLPDDHISRFQAESELAQEHMKVLKSHLKDNFADHVFTYSAEYGGLSGTTGRDLVTLTGLEKFAEQVKGFFQTAIDRAYPESDLSEELNPEEKERELQWMFIQDKADTLIGRDSELSLLLDYARNEHSVDLEKIDGSQSTMRKAEDWDVMEGDNLVCVVTAAGGWGKTALLAGLVQRAKKEGMEVVYHFVGSTATSAYLSTLLQRLTLALNPDNGGFTEPEVDVGERKKQLRQLLSQWRETDKQILIVIDGVNELDVSDSVYHLSWLPPALPPSVRCVVSANTSHLPTTARLKEHPAYLLSLSTLDTPHLQALATSFFLQFGKKLEASQMQHMLESTKVDNPLWMKLMCEELRVFGDFRTMDRKLQALPDSMDAFLSSVITRLLQEDETGYVKRTLFLMAASSTGLPVDHMLTILGDKDTKCPPLYWAQARRVLKPYTRSVQSASDGEEYFTFIHEAMWKGVQQSMESSEEDRKTWHKQLADFYQYRCDNPTLTANYLPQQLQLGRMHARLVEFIRKDPLATKIPAFKRSQLLNEHRCRNPSDTTVPGTRELVLCKMCSLQSGGFNPGLRMPNKDVCYLCSCFLFSHSRSPARICTFHAARKSMGPNMTPCCICGNVIVKRQPGAGLMLGPMDMSASLCQMCGFGIYGKTCSMIKDNLA